MTFGASETLHVPERLVVAPARGRFFPLETARGQWVHTADVIGEIRIGAQVSAVTPPFDGRLMGCLALKNELVDPGDPLFWLRVG